jgi:hypothetical protein
VKAPPTSVDATVVKHDEVDVKPSPTSVGATVVKHDEVDVKPSPTSAETTLADPLVKREELDTSPLREHATVYHSGRSTNSRSSPGSGLLFNRFRWPTTVADSKSAYTHLSTDRYDGPLENLTKVVELPAEPMPHRSDDKAIVNDDAVTGKWTSHIFGGIFNACR